MSVSIYKSKNKDGYVSYTYVNGVIGVPIDDDGKPNIVMNGMTIPNNLTKIYVIVKINIDHPGCVDNTCGEYMSLESAMLGWNEHIKTMYSNNDDIFDHHMFEIFEYDVNKVYSRTTDQIAYRYTGEIKNTSYDKTLWQKYTITGINDDEEMTYREQSLPQNKQKYYVMTSGDWNNTIILAISTDKDRLLQVCKNINETVSKGDNNAIATVQEFTELFDEIPELDKCQFFIVSFDNKLKHLNTVLKSRAGLTRKNFIAEGYPVSHINDYRKNAERGLWNRNDVFMVDVVAKNENQAKIIAKEALINYLKEESK